MRKRIPRFVNEDRERQFWSKHDSTDFIDWKKGKRIVPGRLKPSVRCAVSVIAKNVFV